MTGIGLAPFKTKHGREIQHRHSGDSLSPERLIFEGWQRLCGLNKIHHTVRGRGRDYGIQLFDGLGRRKYLSASERERFVNSGADYDERTRLFFATLTLTGCRISECLELIPARVDEGTLSLVFRTLKRRKIVYRSVPVPSKLIRELASLTKARPHDEAIWQWSRTTAWKRVKSAMRAVQIRGPQASPKGLRHGFGVAAAMGNVPISKIAKWLGHSSQLTTAIYLEAVGDEERELAKRVWLGSYAGV